jgi:hypothetical protein
MAPSLENRLKDMKFLENVELENIMTSLCLLVYLYYWLLIKVHENAAMILLFGAQTFNIIFKKHLKHKKIHNPKKNTFQVLNLNYYCK